MNVIPKSASTPVPATAKAVPVSTLGSAAETAHGGNSLPPDGQAAKAQRVDVKEMQANVEAAVAQMNEFIQSTQRDLHFSYDKAAGETVVKVLDRKTQEVIRQIPDETFLKLAHSKDSDGNFQLFSAQA